MKRYKYEILREARTETGIYQLILGPYDHHFLRWSRDRVVCMQRKLHLSEIGQPSEIVAHNV